MAEELAARHGPPVTYVADDGPAGRPRTKGRVAAHRRRHDPAWATVEAGEDLPGLLAELRGTVLVDSLGPWVAVAGGGPTATSAAVAALRAAGDTVVVSDEVGTGGAPLHRAGARVPRRARCGQPRRVRRGRPRLSRRGRPGSTPARRSAPMRRALSFLTVLGGPPSPNERTLVVVPARGDRVGAVVGTAWWLAGRVWPAAVAAVVAVAVDAASPAACISTAWPTPPTACSGGWARPRFEIMADPRVGAFGAVALVLVLSLRTTALAVTVARPWSSWGCGADRAR